MAVSLQLGRIEKKRTVVPTLAEAIQDGREVNWEYFYSLLFTAENLKLVHIACHKKTTHKLQCDHRRIYRPQTESRRKQPAQQRPAPKRPARKHPARKRPARKRQ